MIKKCILSLLFFCSTLANAQNVDWSAETPSFPDGSLDHTLTDVNGLAGRNLRIQTTDNGLGLSTNYPKVLGSGILSLSANAPSGSSMTDNVTMVWTFSQPACGLTFNIEDIDNSTTGATINFVDQVTLTGTDHNGASLPNPTISAATENSVSGNVITGTAAGSPTNTITYGSSCVSSLTIVLNNGPGVKTNPNSQTIRFTDISSQNDAGSFAVDLVSFEERVSSNSIDLSWQTSSETQNAGFEVQKSRDARSFETIGRLAGQGDSDVLNSYNFEDFSPFVGSNYYRLKQKDFDGTVNYSKIIQVEWSSDIAYANVYPNPLPKGRALSIQKSENLELIGIYNTQGQLQSQSNKLYPGVYYLKFSDNENTNLAKKLIVE